MVCLWGHILYFLGFTKLLGIIQHLFKGQFIDHLYQNHPDNFLNQILSPILHIWNQKCWKWSCGSEFQIVFWCFLPLGEGQVWFSAIVIFLSSISWLWNRCSSGISPLSPEEPKISKVTSTWSEGISACILTCSVHGVLNFTTTPGSHAQQALRLLPTVTTGTLHPPSQPTLAHSPFKTHFHRTG